ncbi:hypothetical protein L218DRAFT_4590 [Marasmius fiardii PR-910]|nr:hypothetical protein L218DRAFT_4590 [Marasmius fiardii PR-910]
MSPANVPPLETVVDQVRSNKHEREAIASGENTIENDGTCKIPILDGGRRVVGVVASQPRDPSYSSACQCFHLSIMKEGRQLPANSRRGGWLSLACGLSYRMGQLYPCRTKSSERDEAIMRRILDSEEAKQISIFQSASLARCCPHNYTLYEQAKTFIQAHRKSKTERWNFQGSVFAAATINFGPRTWTHRRQDVQNLPHGWCAITVLGDLTANEAGI